MIKNCEFCNESFKTSRSDGRFCSNSCRQKGYLQKHPEANLKKKENAIKYYHAHKEEQIQYMKEWNKKNPDKRKLYLDVYFEKHPERAHSLKEIYGVVRKLLGNKCSMCGSTINLHIHHKKYHENPDDTVIEDLALICDKCHPHLRRWSND
jgi:5-methylcytosine-specific restriction endonuclease McrA